MIKDYYKLGRTCPYCGVKIIDNARMCVDCLAIALRGNFAESKKELKK